MSQQINLSRRSFLHGRTTAVAPIRPPGALPEAGFVDACTACGGCVAACPENIIVRSAAGYPEVDFQKGECTFCLACVAACEDSALLQDAHPPWHIEIQISDQCLTRQQVVCRTCGDECQTEAIRFQPIAGRVAAPEIQTDFCTGCGACVAVCPENAMSAVRRD